MRSFGVPADSDFVGKPASSAIRVSRLGFSGASDLTNRTQESLVPPISKPLPSQGTTPFCGIGPSRLPDRRK